MKQPEPSAATVALWLRNVNREQLHTEGWIAVNKRFHGIARAARPYLQAQFPDEQDQTAAFDGLTLALLAVAHFEDIETVSRLFDPSDTSGTAQSLLPDGLPPSDTP